MTIFSKQSSEHNLFSLDQVRVTIIGVQSISGSIIMIVSGKRLCRMLHPYLALNHRQKISKPYVH